MKNWFSLFGAEQLDWSAQNPELNPSNSFRMNWISACEPDQITNQRPDQTRGEEWDGVSRFLPSNST